MKRLLSRFGVVEIIIGLLLFISIVELIQLSTYNYNRQVSMQNQQQLLTIANETQKILDVQGNVSAHTRQQILTEIAKTAEHGGIANNEELNQNQGILLQMNASIQKLNHTLQNADITIKHVEQVAKQYNHTTNQTLAKIDSLVNK